MFTTTRNAVIVGGPNGAGKTTLVHQVLEVPGFSYLSADQIAEQIAPGRPESISVEAGREFLRQVQRAIDDGIDIIIETTLAGRGFRHVFERLNSNDYRNRIAFVFLKSADSHVVRVGDRVRKGGHRVPEEDIRRRFGRSLYNFWETYRFLVDEWQLFYNSGRQPMEIAIGDRSGFLVTEQQAFDLFLQQVAKARPQDV